MRASDDRPLIVRRDPAPGVDAPAGTRRFCIGFDQPMDTSRGRCRLSWSRLRLHTKNVTMPRYAWDVRDDCMGWNDAGTELWLQLSAPLCDGFRIRVEWSDLFGRASSRPPLPEERERGASYVVVVLGEPRGGMPPAPPTLGSMPLAGASDVRRDLTVELYPSQPLASFPAAAITVIAAGERVPFHLHTNRNPPDWIYLQLERLLPVNSDVVVTVAAGALRNTLGASSAADWQLRFSTGDAPPALAMPVPSWSEPPPGLADHPTGRIEAALRCSGWPMLAEASRLQQQIELIDVAAGQTIDGIAVDIDPTPAHYRTIFVRSTRSFGGLRHAHEYALRWRALGWPGIAAAQAGELRFRTHEADGAPIFLAGCPHVSIVASQDGSELQVAMQVYAEIPIREGWVALCDAPEQRYPLAPMQSPNFRDMVDGALRQAPPVLWTTMAGRPRLPDVAAPQTRQLAIVLRDQLGRERRFEGLGFDMTRAAIRDLQLTAGARPSARWELGTPVDSQHISIHDERGRTYYGGLFDAAVRDFVLPSGWDLPAGRYLFQLWLLRATPQDDLWDFAVADQWFSVEV